MFNSNQQNAFQIGEMMNLKSMDIDIKNLKFGVTSFESDKQITIRESDQNGNPVLTTVDMSSKQISKKPIKAEMALQHLNKNILALRAKKTDNPQVNILQIFDMDNRKKLKHLEVNENIVFWKWVSNDILAFVTSSGVFHTDISIEIEQQSVKIMDRNGPLVESQIVGYQLDPESKWSILFGISTPDGGKTIHGHIQLFLIESQRQQLLEGHCAVFGEAQVHDGHQSVLFAFFEKKHTETISKVHITEISSLKEGTQKFKKNQEIILEQPNDFPIYMQISSKYGLLYIVTKFGSLFIYEVSTCQKIYQQKVSQNIIFVGCRNSINDGLYLINKEGSVISVNVNSPQLLPFILQNCQQLQDVQQMVFSMASRYSLQGCEKAFLDGFNQAFAIGDYNQAAVMAANAPGTLLRNNDTINKFKSLKANPGQPQPILQYFQTLLSKGKLNSIESVELCRPVLMQGKKNIVQQWFQENKLDSCEELGDLIKQYDTQMAIKIYESANATSKLQQIYMETGQLDKLMSGNSNQNVNYMAMISQMISSGNFEGALNSAKQVHNKNPGVLQVHVIGELFMQNGRLQEMTAFLVDCMKGNKKEDAGWQTRVLEQNLMVAPQVSEAIMQMNIWTQYDRQRIAQLCEQKMLFQRALENYQDIKDIKRVILNVQQLNQQWLLSFVSNLESEWILQCMQDLTKHNKQNLQLVVQIAQKNFAKLNVASVVQVFEQVGSYDGVYYFLGSVINNTDDHDIYFKYIEAAVRCNQLVEVERIIQEKQDNYDPIKVKNYLKDQKLSNPKSLILLCDKFGYIDELTKYLYKNCDTRFIEIYLSKVNPQASPIVLGTLIDMECEENYIKQLLFNLRGLCPAEETVNEFEKRNKLRLLEKWLEGVVQMGNQQPAVHNAVAKLKIDMNQNPGEFLVQNQYYDSKVVGSFCEERDPHLAYVAYKRAWGQCDDELIELTNKNQMYRLQARYCVERMDVQLWAKVLDENNQFRNNIVDQVVSQALPESKNADEVVKTVQAFMAADLTTQLIQLLDRIVLHNSEFSKFKKLQNLLILTSIKYEPAKVMDYIKRLDNYDGAEIAEEAISDQYRLYEEGFVIFDKFQMHNQALDVLINKIEDMQRGHEYANSINTAQLWSILGLSHLNKNEIQESVNCFIKAKDFSEYLRIIHLAEQNCKFELLVQYLVMSRELQKDQAIDNSLVFCYANLNKMQELEEILNDSNSVDALKVGDRCFDQLMYEAARILYQKTQNNSKIASCLVKLKQWQKALEFAKRANTTKTWREVCVACVEQQEYKLAAIAGLEVIVIADMLEDLIIFYEQMSVSEEIIMLLQNGLAQNKQNQKGIVTELGILYAKYQSEKLMEHCKMHFQNINISKMLSVCYKYALWNEAVYLHSNYDEYDKAVIIMMDHSPTAFNHTQFVSILQKVSNSELFKKSILFYLDEQPMQLNDLLKNIHNKLDLTQTVLLLKKTGYIELVLPFLKQVQVNNNQQVNETLNEIFLQQEDYESLWKSIKNNEQFDNQNLAKLTENHELVEFRRIAAYLYRKTQKYDKSIQLSLQDKTYRDSIETALESGKQELVEELLKFFIKNDLKEFFTVCSYTCYELIRPDVILEFAWRYQMFDYAMPFMIQITKELTHKVDNVQKKAEEKEKKEKKLQANQENKPLEGFAGLGGLMDPLGGQLMLMGQNQQMGMNVNQYLNGSINTTQNSMGMGMNNVQQNQFFNQF